MSLIKYVLKLMIGEMFKVNDNFNVNWMIIGKLI